MKPRGMRFIENEEAEITDLVIDEFTKTLKSFGFKKLYMPNVYGLKTFTDKAGSEIVDQMYVFKDKKGRDLCLCPEGTAIAREWFLNSLEKSANIFYVQKFYRYERPQAGRYREFLQFGVESFGENQIDTRKILEHIIKKFPYLKMIHGVKRGLDYYIEDGFEVINESLGAQKQIAGGGIYDCGNGFAIGVDRFVMGVKQC
jgi:histidyl-tRNA synthetase